MDVAKYIGLFLHKYQYCYLPNLGNFLVSRKPAAQKGDQIEGPQYQVSFTFANGSIDDALANFIATNERISIANAANAIKDFCTNTRETLADGGEVTIPGFGRFIQTGGKNSFVSDQHIEVHTRTIPYFKTNTPVTNTSTGETIAELYEKMQLKEPTSEDEIIIKPPTVNWSKIIILALIVAAILAAGIAIFWYMNKQNNQQKDETATPALGSVNNTSAADTGIAVNAAAPAAPASGYSYAILQFNDKTAADKKLEKLKAFGQNTYGKDLSLKDNGAGTYYIAINVPGASDTAVVKDSLRKFFNPGGTVTILK